jgi:hypothetical protein
MAPKCTSCDWTAPRWRKTKVVAGVEHALSPANGMRTLCGTSFNATPPPYDGPVNRFAGRCWYCGQLWAAGFATLERSPESDAVEVRCRDRQACAARGRAYNRAAREMRAFQR